MIGPASCEGLRTGMLERRFELSRFDGKSLLYASDECSDALLRKGAHVLKSLTGGDTLTTEVKCKNEHPVIHGNFSVIIVSNPDLARYLANGFDVKAYTSQITADSVAALSDGAIVGSAIVKIVEKEGRSAAPAVGAFVKQMKDALR